jgi:hypothetical protein
VVSRAGVEAAAAGDRRPTYADLGRAVVDRLIELGRETGEALGMADNLRREVKENRAARIDAEQRASRYFERIKELEHKLEMAEANLRTVLAAARGRGATAAPPDNEMEAVLRVLKGTPGRDGQDGVAADGEADGGLSVAALDAIGAPAAVDGEDGAAEGGSTHAAAGDGDGPAGDEDVASTATVDVLDTQDVQALEQAPDGEVHEAFGE